MEEGTGAHEAQRIEALGDQLVEIHDMLRGQLNDLRAALDSPDAGTGDDRVAPLDHQIRKQCLSFCEFLHGHHTAEDEHMFPGLAVSHPELAPVLERLTREHSTISRALDRIQELASGRDAGTGPVREEVERLAAQVEAHLDHEEAQIVEALNSYGPVTL
ncbi:hemerythrin domain-containing protein [Nocardiopsis lambiniae]|uniref:Hemerythrin domain-containing protein n=1 Tax=Nocardiopsis lambiniae TaxID=3075539 RepID=A0ABU2M320_9ACTN|nr:hemerythrin domain-containing protein [Nocardiopsis sp. DSM 44743]MDT0327022.1 hemerythrin domain-containing protein [Nocardiopsis sp. DSM 44743]